MHRPAGQIDAFVSSDEGSDMDVSESEADEPTITQPFTAVAPSDYRSASKVPNEGSFVSNMRNYAAQQERDPSNRIVAPRVEHFNTESNPIQVDSDSDDESTCSFHTAPSSPREEDNNNHELELELEIAKLAENVERNNRTIGDIRAEIVDLEKQKSDLNLEILESKVRSSISTRKRTAQREIPKTTQAPINQSNLANFTNTGSNKQVPPVPPQIGINKSLADTTKNKGKERAHSLQPSPLRHHIPIESHSHTRPKQSVSPVATPQRVIVQPTLQKQRNNTNSTNSTNSTILAQNNMENAKDISLKRRADEKQMQRNNKKLRNIELRNEMRTEKKKDAMEINRTATELATSMAIEKPPPSASQEAPMEEGELVNSSSTSSDDDNESSRNSIPVVETTANGLGGAKAIESHILPMHHTANRNNFQPYKSALSSIGLGPSPITSSSSEDKPLCTFEQNGGTCNNDSCQAAHFRDFL